jgi:hypothetical protein
MQHLTYLRAIKKDAICDLRTYCRHSQRPTDNGQTAENSAKPSPPLRPPPWGPHSIEDPSPDK